MNKFYKSRCLIISFGVLSSCGEDDVSKQSDADLVASKAEKRQEGLGFSSDKEKEARSLEQRYEREMVLLESILAKKDASWSDFEHLANELIEKDLDTALRMFSRMDLTGRHQQVEQFLFEHFYAKGDWKEALRAMNALGYHSSLTAPLLSRVVEAYGIKEPDKAWAWVQEHPDLPGIANSAGLLGQTMGRGDEVQTVVGAVLSKDNLSSVEEAYVTGAVSQWVKEDPEGALTFLSEQEESPVLDRAVYEFIHFTGALDAENTIAWAELIHDEGMRRSGILQTAKMWEREAPDRYQQWKNDARESLGEDLWMELP